jgi:hypothetical protein
MYATDPCPSALHALGIGTLVFLSLADHSFADNQSDPMTKDYPTPNHDTTLFVETLSIPNKIDIS